MTRFFLVRHGETEWNRERRIQGVSDIPLNDTGRAQAAALGDILVGHNFDLIVSSPLSRADETARIIAQRLGMPAPITVPDLIERNYGEAEGSSGADLDLRYRSDRGRDRDCGQAQLHGHAERGCVRHMGRRVVAAQPDGIRAADRCARWRGEVCRVVPGLLPHLTIDRCFKEISQNYQGKPKSLDCR